MMRINEQVTCYLTPEAQEVISTFIAKGMDEDFAISLLESMWPEANIYELPVEDEA